MSQPSGPSVYPYLLNLRSYAKGIIESRPGTVLVAGAGPGPAHSLKRIVDILPSATESYARIVGSGTALYVGQTSFTEEATGFSGNPLALVDYRPVQSPETWCYIGDSSKTGKVRTDGTFYNMGIAPPLNAPTTVYGPDSYQIIDLFNETAPANWSCTGQRGSMGNISAVSTTIEAISYDSGSTGWATLYPTADLAANLGAGYFLIVGSGATEETVFVNSLQSTLSSTTVAAITGSPGSCTITATSHSFIPGDGQIIGINIGNPTGEYIQVFNVQIAVSGAVSFDSFCQNSHSAGEALTGTNQSLRCFLQYMHNTGETIAAGGFSIDLMGTTPDGLLSENVEFNLADIQGRPQQSTDVISVWINTPVPTYCTHFTVMFDDDPSVNNFTQNYYSYDAYAQVNGFTANQWGQVSIPISSLVHTGSSGLGWGNIAAVGIQINASGIGGDGDFTFYISGFSIYGEYGPDVGDTGVDYIYRYRYRSQVTGAVSLPGPPQRTGLDADDQAIAISGIVASTDPQVALIDVYRYGGALTNWIYVGTTNNVTGATFYDDFQDSDIADNPLMTYDDFRPFPTVDIPHSGYCNVDGYAVTWVSGDKFNVLWAPGSEITINGVAQSLYNYPSDTEDLQIVNAVGVLSNVPFSIPQATLDAQTLPCLWGPFLNALWACGDLYQPGVLFATKGNNPDSAPDTSYIEITTPSEPLMNGCIYGGYNYVFSSERMFEISQDYTGENIAIYNEVPDSIGLYSRWGLCIGKNGIYGIWRTGIWRSVGGAQKMITDPDLMLLFPHEGQPGQPVTLGSVTFYPPDFTQTANLRLAWADFHLFFDYINTLGQYQTLVFNETFGRWGPDTYAFNGSAGAIIHYQEEAPNLHSNLIGGSDGNVYQESSAVVTDNNNTFTSTLRMAQAGGPQGFVHVRDGYVGYLTGHTRFTPIGNILSVIVNANGEDYTQGLPATDGSYENSYLTLNAVKGARLEWAVSAIGEWKLFIQDTFFRVKGWAADTYEKFNPFANLRREL